MTTTNTLGTHARRYNGPTVHTAKDGNMDSIFDTLFGLMAGGWMNTHSLDHCGRCGKRILDSDDNGMEDDYGQRWCISHEAQGVLHDELTDKQAIVMYILEEHGEVSFTELLNRTGWTRPVLGTITNSLKKRDLIGGRWSFEDADSMFYGNEAN
jgi:hypothetical protein